MTLGFGRILKLITGRRGRIVETRQHATQGTPDMITLTPEDRAQVYAILMTHAEMQDAESMRTLAVLGRLKADQPDEVDMIDDLEESINLCEQDSDNLKRLASLFGEI